MNNTFQDSSIDHINSLILWMFRTISYWCEFSIVEFYSFDNWSYFHARLVRIFGILFAANWIHWIGNMIFKGNLISTEFSLLPNIMLDFFFNRKMPCWSLHPPENSVILTNSINSYRTAYIYSEESFHYSFHITGFLINKCF